MILKSRSLVKRLAWLFRWSTPDEKAMAVQLLRLCVLYEDFQVEVSGAMADNIATLDATSLETRRFYFVRRQCATFMEISGALKVLNANRAFKSCKSQFSPMGLKQWDEAVKFFSDVDNHALLKGMRNDLGGHFLDSTAEFALDNVSSDAVGVLEFYRRGTGADVKIKFAYEFVATALIKQKDASQTEMEFIQEAFEFMRDANGHVINVVHIVFAEVLLKR